MITAIPFITEADPLISEEGILDPLGLAAVSERLAEEVLPGLRARMERPRFLTAMAVAAAVCERLDELARDGVTPPHIVFEWLLVEAFARLKEDESRGVPGILKARIARRNGESMRASAYLRSPSVFGFHGVYKPIATHTRILDEDFRLSELGYELLQAWESDCVERAGRQMLAEAVRDGLTAGHNENGNLERLGMAWPAPGSGGD